MIATLMVWAIDCGDLPLALRIGAYVVHHNLIMPDNFGRTAATVLTEEICNPVLTQAGTDADADLSAFIEPLDTLREIVTDQDMPDEVRANYAKRAPCPPWPDRCGQHGLITEALREAMHLNPNAGVKREIATLSRALKKPIPQPHQKMPAHRRRRTKAAKVKRQRGSLQHEKPPRRRRRSAVND